MAQAKIRKEFLTQMDARISRDECAEIIRLSAAKARPGTNLSNRARCCESAIAELVFLIGNRSKV
jgi:hypothetical protein